MYKNSSFPYRFKIAAVFWVVFAATGFERGLLITELLVHMIRNNKQREHLQCTPLDRPTNIDRRAYLFKGAEK